MKHKLTKADLKKRLSDLGFKEGDEIILPSGQNQKNASTQNTDEGGDEGGKGDGEDGENHPTKKPKN
jgi:hypothetical protein